MIFSSRVKRPSMQEAPTTAIAVDGELASEMYQRTAAKAAAAA